MDCTSKQPTDDRKHIARQMGQAPRSNHAFTLIELLVVVAIIALLIAILLPSLGRAKAQAQKVACASRMRQLGTVVALYATEYDQWLTPGTYFANWADGKDNGWGNNNLPPYYPQMWMQVLVPYIATPIQGVATTNVAPWTPGVLRNYGSIEVWGYAGTPVAQRTVFWCPQDPRQPNAYGVNPVHATSVTPDDGWGVSYAPFAYGYVTTAVGRVGTVLGQKSSTIVTPNDAAMFVEGWNLNGNINLWYTPSSYGIPNFQSLTLAGFRFRHNNLCNVLYADNHVAAISKGDVPPQGTQSVPQRFWGYGVAWGY